MNRRDTDNLKQGSVCDYELKVIRIKNYRHYVSCSRNYESFLKRVAILLLFNMYIDKETPVIDFVENITVDTDHGRPDAVVDWTQPNITDNSGNVTVTISHNSSGVRYPIGRTRVDITAWDASGNVAMTSFWITVEGKVHWTKAFYVLTPFNCLFLSKRIPL